MLEYIGSTPVHTKERLPAAIKIKCKARRSELRVRNDVIPCPGHEFECCPSPCGLRNGDSQLSKCELNLTSYGRSFDLPLNCRYTTVMESKRKGRVLAKIIVFDGTQRPWRWIVETNANGGLFQTKGLYSGPTIFIS